MGKGSQNKLKDLIEPENSKSQSNVEKPVYSWAEVRKHNKKNDCWIVINNLVYNVTKFQNKHPGGSRLFHLYAGQDASEVFNAFHKEFEKVNKYSKMYLIGQIDANDSKLADDTVDIKQRDLEMEKIRKEMEIRKDFDEIRQAAINMKLFEPSYTFFFLQFFQIVFCHCMGFYVLWAYGSGWRPYLASLFFHVLAQGQANWNQHDVGHSSILAKPKFNRYIQMFYLGIIKGASADWWNYMHNQHHAKPNVIDKDPDVRIDPVFVLGNVEPVKKAEKNVKYNEKFLYPYTIQHYFFPFAAPLLFPVYFQIMTFRYAIIRRKYADLATMIPMYLIFFSLTIPVFGSFWTAFSLFISMRLIESSWFTWVSQCNHIVMDVHEDDSHDSWLHLQLKATCNIKKSFFNDWFTGHLNFQIEHHLFPTMPRHNLYKVQPLIQSLCKKHNVDYVVKPLGQAFKDILLSLRKSGEMWKDAYDELRAGM